jgi:hypothetical protein
VPRAAPRFAAFDIMLVAPPSSAASAAAAESAVAGAALSVTHARVAIGADGAPSFSFPLAAEAGAAETDALAAATLAAAPNALPESCAGGGGGGGGGAGGAEADEDEEDAEDEIAALARRVRAEAERVRADVTSAATPRSAADAGALAAGIPGDVAFAEGEEVMGSLWAARRSLAASETQTRPLLARLANARALGLLEDVLAVRKQVEALTWLRLWALLEMPCGRPDCEPLRGQRCAHRTDL